MPRKKQDGESSAVRPHGRERKSTETVNERPSPTAKAGKTEGSKLEKIWSRRMALCGLKRIVEAALEGARTEVRDEDGALVEVKFNPTAANAATKAIEVANRMLGYTAPEEEGEGDSLIFVDLGDAREFAE